MIITINIPESQVPLIKAGITFNESGKETFEEVMTMLLSKHAEAWAEAGRNRLIENEISTLKQAAELNVPILEKFAGQVNPAPEK